MGKRRREVVKSTLRLRIISSNLAASSLTTDEVVAHLRSHFWDYSRLPNNIFTSNVERILTSLRQQRDSGDEFGETNSAANSSANSISMSTSGSVDDDDAGINAKVETEIDLMKSTLRDSYVKKNKSVRKPEAENNVEIQTGGKDGRKLGNGEISRNKENAVPSPSFDDLGGMNDLLKVLARMVLGPLRHPKLLEDARLGSMDGILLYGPPGCGKTMLACAIANEAGVPFYKISSTELVSGVAGDSEEKIRDLFKQAHMTAPSIIFIDEIDAIASKREHMQREMEKRITTQLITCMDAHHHSNNKNELEEGSNNEPMPVLVIGATNRPNEIDLALRRPGRFGQEFALGVPDENARFEILSVLIRKYKIECTVDVMKIARSTPGFVAADLNALVKKANYLAYDRVVSKRETKLLEENIRRWWTQPWSEEESNSFCVSMSDFEDAITMVQVSSKREGFSLIPSTKWDDIGGHELLRKEFEVSIVQRIKIPEKYKKLHIGKENGFLLFGPPGCGKTSIAKAVANKAGANFIHVKGPDLLNKYVGESERAIRTLFTRARTCAPCILFFDEVDALIREENDGGQVHHRVARTLQIELDGGDSNQDVYVIGATNRLEVIGSDFLRHGRFGKKIYVGLPNADERSLILKVLARDKPIDADVDLDAIARSDACFDFSGADLHSLMNEACKEAVLTDSLVIRKSHFEAALETMNDKDWQKHLARRFIKQRKRKSYQENIKKTKISKKCKCLSGRL